MASDPEMPKQNILLSGLPVPVSNALRSSKFGFFYIAQMVLRILVIAFSLSGAVITITGTQTLYGPDFLGHPALATASYTDASAFRYKVIADFVVFGLSLLSVILFIALDRPKSDPKNFYYLFLHDLVSVLVLLSGVSAAIAIGLVGKVGQSKSQWNPICGMFPKFCDKMTVSIVASFVAVVCLVFLTMLSAHKLKATTPYLERI